MLKRTLGPWGETLDELIGVARDAEAAGFDAVWVPELHRSAFVPTTAIAVATRHIDVGTGIAWAFARSELVTALHALDLDELSDGRFRLGLGTGVRRLVENWHHAHFGKPAAHVRETIALIRELIARAHTGEPISFEGDHVRVDIRNYQRPFPPRRERIPIYLAAVGPVMARTAGAVADGWLGHELGSPTYLRERILPNLAVGVQQAGRRIDDLERVVSVCCVPDQDARQAKRWAAGLVAFYASVRTYRDFFGFHGFGAEAERIQACFRQGDVDAMIAATPDAMVDTFTFAGTPDEVRSRLADYDGLADAVKLSPPTHFVPPEVTRATQQAIVEMFAVA